MAYFSAVPDCLAALLAMFQTSPGLEGVDVVDGPPRTDSSALEVMCIGYSPSADVDAVDMTGGFGDLGSSRDREQFTVRCSVAVLNGDRDTLAARLRAYALYDAAGFVIADDPTLRKSVMNARLSTHTLHQMDTTGGILVRIDFGVDADAFTRR